MQKSKHTRLRGSGLRALTLAAATSLLSVAGAQAQVNVIGNAQGCFGGGCVPAEAFASVVDGVPLNFLSAGVDFTGISAGGTLSISGVTGNFGSISVGTAAPDVSLTPTPFTLLLTFLNPLTASQTFDAIITGVVSLAATGGIIVDYDPTPGPTNINESSAWQPFFDPISGLSGELMTTAFGQPIPSGSTADLRGQIDFRNVGVVPEPASMLLLGTGLAGLVGVSRRRRKQSDVA